MKLMIWAICVVCIASCTVHKKAADTDMPACLAKMLDSLKKEGVNMPGSITKYSYRSKTVYYVLSGCCDQFNPVYDNECNILGAPDGGLTGKGDGKLTGFKDEATNPQLIWRKE
jgi:hypothetical protein